MADRATEPLAPALTGSTGGAGASSISGRVRRRYSLLTRRDKLVLGLMVGIPLFFDLALVWGPAIVSVFLSFTNWNGIGSPFDAKVIGLKNYENLIGSYPFFWPAVQHNFLWLAWLMFIATPIGMFLAVLLDREIRGTRIYQTIFYIPVVLSLAVIGIIWQLQYAPEQGFINNVLGRTGNDNLIDWLGDPSLNLWAALVATSWRHVGYIMVLYLAGLKAFDPALREAAKVDGASERQTFFRVVFPVMMPINVVIVVITTIEALRAFDIAYIINHGKNGLELLSTLITNNAISESNRLGFGSAIAVVLLVISLVPIVTFLVADAPGGTRVTATSPTMLARARVAASGRRRVALYVFLTGLAVVWLFPLAWGIYTALRPFSDTQRNGYISLPSTLNFDNFLNAWSQGEFQLHYFSTLIVTIPAVIVTLLLASMVAFAVSRIQLAVQPVRAAAVHGRQPAPAAGDHRPGLQALQLHPRDPGTVQ